MDDVKFRHDNHIYDGFKKIQTTRHQEMEGKHVSPATYEEVPVTYCPAAPV